MTSFCVVARRINVVGRLITASEWLADGAYAEALTDVQDLEADVLHAIEADELEDYYRFLGDAQAEHAA